MAFYDPGSGEVPYCASCSTSLVSRGREHHVAVAIAQDHARVTGHPVSLATADTWTHVETIVGEPALPLWERSDPQ
jgi:hypothetical protein